MKTIGCLTLAIAGLTIATARADKPARYPVSLQESKIGTTQVKTGEYRLLVHRDEAKVQLMNLKTGDVVDLAAKVEDGPEKFSNTEVHAQEVNGVRQVLEIRIGGTKLRVDFRQPS